MTDKRNGQDRVGGRITRRRLVGWGAASSALAFGGTLLAPGPWRIAIAQAKPFLLLVELKCDPSDDSADPIALADAVLAVTEGADKPLKYPHMFAAAGLVIVNKIDLLPYVDFDLEVCSKHARSINPHVQILPVSATTGEGIQAWYNWIDGHAN